LIDEQQGFFFISPHIFNFCPFLMIFQSYTELSAGSMLKNNQKWTKIEGRNPKSVN